MDSNHSIAFEKLNREHVSLLIKKYLAAYRLNPTFGDEFTPFTPGAITCVAELNDNNAAKILKSCWELLERAVQDSDMYIIDEAYVREKAGRQGEDLTSVPPTIDNADAIDLSKKAAQGK